MVLIKRNFDIGRLLSDVESALNGRRLALGERKKPCQQVPATQRGIGMELWYPKAAKVVPPLPTKGKYKAGYPSGAIVHYTAGAYGLAALDIARDKGYTYFLIDEHGTVHQGFPLDSWGPHAGASSWPALPASPNGVSPELVGIEIECAGLLSVDGSGGFRTWWGKQMAPGEVRTVAAPYSNPGPYHRYTEVQEQALIALLLWLKANNPAAFSFDLVLGHEEVAPKRKTDPGGSLSVPMSLFRSQLAAAYAQAERAKAPSV